MMKLMGMMQLGRIEKGGLEQKKTKDVVVPSNITQHAEINSLVTHNYLQMWQRKESSVLSGAGAGLVC